MFNRKESNKQVFDLEVGHKQGAKRGEGAGWGFAKDRSIRYEGINRKGY